jgi:excisionase family DNA binding protein
VNNINKLGELLRIEEFAALLNIEPATARAWLLRRRIAKVRVGSRAIRIPASEVHRLLSERMIPACENSHGN